MKISEDVLRKLYIDDELPLRLISAKLSIPKTNLCRLLKKFNITTRNSAEANKIARLCGRRVTTDKQREAARKVVISIRGLNEEQRTVKQSSSLRKSYANGLKPWNKDKGKIKDVALLARRRRIEASWWDEIKTKIKKRDNYSCQNCGRTDIKLDVHHIDEQENHQENNLITLCCVCHMRVHKGKIKI